MTIRAVLFDVGGPIDTEVESERYIDAQIRASLAAAGVPVTDPEYAAANRLAVESFAPNAYKAIIWRLCGKDHELARRLAELPFPGRSFEPRDGMAELLHSLADRGLKLGLAANQPARILDELDRLGMGQCFTHREVSGHHGYRKPDVRLFLRACDDLGVAPYECVMVGDRIDNDIAPARRLGMHTVLFRTGRHRDQQPRDADEVPDFEVADVPALTTALAALIARHSPNVKSFEER
ncbi:MAG TPA: HAD family hydrolase [Candidatus Binataceae bacterium]|nr:HAD family hydrolase [Candidatus Binataceae bacterium]